MCEQDECKADTLEGKINNAVDCKQHLSKGFSISAESWIREGVCPQTYKAPRDPDLIANVHAFVCILACMCINAMLLFFAHAQLIGGCQCVIMYWFLLITVMLVVVSVARVLL